MLIFNLFYFNLVIKYFKIKYFINFFKFSLILFIFIKFN